jgi:epoxyqueuosine reductase
VDADSDLTGARGEIRAQALDAGFDAVGFAPAAAAPLAGERLKAFLAAGMQGDMGWLEAKAARRVSPDALWPDVASVVVLGMNYGPVGAPLDILKRTDRGAISIYAQGRDYHDVVKKRLKRVARWMHERFAKEVKVFVDTAPVMEKPLAMRGGIGWQGKHTNLVSRAHGSWLFLGEIYTTLDLQPDDPEADHCGQCSACLDICPTKAFIGPYQLDARRCISYLTIEHKGHIDVEFRAAMGNRIYGCDDCLAVCPWNKFAHPASEPALMPRDGYGAPRLAMLARLDDAAFRAFFAGSPIKRTGRDRFVRNVLIAIGNGGRPQDAALLRERLHDASPLVRAMAVWALGRILGDGEFNRLKAAYLDTEPDCDVRREWRRRAQQ